MTQTRDPATYEIIGAAMSVHRELGPGFLEAVYQEAFELELQAKGIPYQREVPLRIRYQGRLLVTGYRVDFVCREEVLVELKALGSLSGIEEAQIINYLKASGLPKALLINFGSKSLELRRFVRGHVPPQEGARTDPSAQSA